MATPANMIIAHEDTLYAEQVARHFRQLGWQMLQADCVAEVRRLARTASVLIISADFPGETGWLTCAKLAPQAPWLKVILVADQPTPDRSRFADFVGGALVEKSAGIRGLVEAVYRVGTLPAAG